MSVDPPTLEDTAGAHALTRPCLCALGISVPSCITHYSGWACGPDIKYCRAGLPSPSMDEVELALKDSTSRIHLASFDAVFCVASPCSHRLESLPSSRPNSLITCHIHYHDGRDHTEARKGRPNCKLLGSDEYVGIPLVHPLTAVLTCPQGDPGVHMANQAKYGPVDVITGDYLAGASCHVICAM